MENLGVDPKLLIAQLINFVLFFLIIKKYIAKPFGNFLNKEIEKEEERKRISDELKKKEEQMVLKEKEMRLKARKEAEEIVKQANKTAEKTKEQLILDAKKQAEEIVIQGRKQIDDEKNTLYADVKKKISDLSIFIINNALKSYLTEEAQKKLTEHILKNYNKEIANYES